jgi:hypothetical protein
MARTVRVDAVRAALPGDFRACRNAPGDPAFGGPFVVEHGDSSGVERKTVPAGGFFLHPAGRELDVHLGGDLNTVHANLRVDQVEQAAQGSRGELAPTLRANDPMIEQLLMAMDGVLTNDVPTALTYVDHLTAMLAAHLTHRYNALGSAAPAMPAVAGLERSQLDGVIDVMMFRLAEPIPLADLAAVATVNHSYTTEYSAGRMFCAGDAVHRHPPSNGLGSNTSIQDSSNLAWKLAAVLKGQASPALLDSYSAERAPVGRQIVDRANLSRSQFAPVFEALGIAGGCDDQGIVAGLAACRAGGADGAKRREQLDEAIRLKNYEFNAHGVELNQRYRSKAVLSEDQTSESWPHDRELYHQPSTRPGVKMPHAWLVDEQGRRVSTLDLIGRGAFSAVTGLSGEVWLQAAQQVEADLGVPLRAALIGGEGACDAYGRCARLCEVNEDSVLLVRPDGYVSWRSTSSPADLTGTAEALRSALAAILGR